ISVMADLRTMVGNMLKSMNYIVALVIGCAAALAFVVLFNLSNINISERVREIATIEVLGFSERETAAYVFRENLVLTLMGAVLGLPLGKLLHAFVMDQIRLDMVCFETKVTPLSYVIAVILTFVFTVTVDLHRGSSSAYYYMSDLTYDYVKINAEYHT
ncbi:MAG: bifunctional ornithine acetyltransferase/N-acetylglutamate synthase, partial [Deltaproteobacteria bacterium]|nr:bifunctional ornithine acetyltransferase/N-acetylglutamate synthase [Deltaproteobacteria bacterium]